MRSIGPISLALLLAVASQASAATLVVAPDGTGDYPTIPAAINASSNNDVIELLGHGVKRVGDGPGYLCRYFGAPR